MINRVHFFLKLRSRKTNINIIMLGYKVIKDSLYSFVGYKVIKDGLYSFVSIIFFVL